MRKVPELSLLSYINGSETDQNQFVDALFNGIKEYGFIILTDHDIDSKSIKSAYSTLKEFYSLPVEVKEKYISPAGGGQRGYTAFGKEHAKDQPVPDLKEFWHVGREIPSGHELEKFYPANIWPKELPHFKTHLLDLFQRLDRTSGYILEALGKALKVEDGYFAKMIQDGNSILRPIYYPAIEGEVPAGAVRAAAHEDINLITILMGATASGLELLDRDGSWIPVETKEGQLVVDTGDMMSRLTNNVLPATTHRVVNPESSGQERFSMPFFVHPRPDADLVCLESCVGEGAKYPPINSHEFLMQRLNDIGLMD